ncbi:MAG TPA: HAMP domain-containing sensor histidine kinase [Polyangiales bacterium]|nr:HAMP domain-containing sensor histidine kinase [Polyangiales bacterium]
MALRARVSELELELKVRDEFIVAAAHELRNPISPLILHAQRIASSSAKAVDGTVSARWLDDQMVLFQRRLGRFLSALHRILDISRLHAGTIDLVPEPVDVSELVREVAGGFERELAASRSELTLDLAPSLPGMFDRVRLEQIVSNLLSNAIRYGNSAPIEIRLRPVQGHDDTPCLELVVADGGLGIDESEHERIFERFQRGPSANRAGFGVGLWIVRELSEAMGGGVRVRSSAGEGATFLVWLPTNRSADDS